MIAEFLQEWCDRNNKLVLVSYDAQTEETDVNYKLKLEIFGFKKIFTQTSANISDALNQVSKQAINFLLRKGLYNFPLKSWTSDTLTVTDSKIGIDNSNKSRFQLHPVDLPPQLSPLFKRRGSAVN